MKVLRTPEERFANLPAFPFSPHYVQVGETRMHYLDEGHGDPILCLHGEPTWCFLYRKLLPVLSQAHRVVAPDLIGFGRSDKLADQAAYTYSLHHDSLVAFVNALKLERITLVCHDWGGLLGLPMAAEFPERFARLVIMNTGLPTGEQVSPAFLAWRTFAATTTDMNIGRVIQRGSVSTLSAAVISAYDAPFPDGTYKAGAHQFPLLVPISPEAPAAAPLRKTRELLRGWTKPTLVMFSDKDPITAGGDTFFRKLIPTAGNEPEIVIHDAGHFLQEDKGEEVAEHIRRFLERRPVPQ